MHCVYLPAMMKSLAPTIVYNHTGCDSVNVPRVDDMYAGDAVVNPQPDLNEGEKAVFSEYVQPEGHGGDSSSPAVALFGCACRCLFSVFLVGTGTGHLGAAAAALNSLCRASVSAWNRSCSCLDVRCCLVLLWVLLTPGQLPPP